MKILKTIVVCLLIASSTNAKNYYLSAQGNDNNVGTSQKKAWQSVDVLKLLELKAGDSILFRCGDTFIGEIVVRQSGKAGKPIVFSAYGKGDLPILSGAIQLKNAQTIALQHQVFAVNQKVLKLYVNDQKQTLARTPNTGYFTTGEGIDKIGFQSTLTEPDGYWVGASLGMRTVDWIFEHRTIAAYEDGKLKFTKPSIYKLAKGYGYFLEDKLELMDTIGEWYSSDKSLQIISNENLNHQKVEGVIMQNGIVLSAGVKNIVINSLQIEKYAANGIWAQKESEYIDVLNNKI